MRVVVDANVVVAALMADGTVRDVLLNTTKLDFFAPDYLKAEIARHEARIAARAQLDPASVAALLEDVGEAVEFVPRDAYGERAADGRRLANQAPAHGDEEYIALALWLEAPIWCLDNDLRRVRQLRVLSTSEVDEL